MTHHCFFFRESGAPNHPSEAKCYKEAPPEILMILQNFNRCRYGKTHQTCRSFSREHRSSISILVYIHLLESIWQQFLNPCPYKTLLTNWLMSHVYFFFMGVPESSRTGQVLCWKPMVLGNPVLTNTLQYIYIYIEMFAYIQRVYCINVYYVILILYYTISSHIHCII